MTARLRALAKYLWIVTLFATGALWLAKRRMRLSGKLVVLTFHRVLDDDEYDHSSSLRGIRVRAKTFERFAAWASRSVEVVRADAVGVGRRSKRPRIALTFDDGWIDTCTRAHPIAARYDLPFTVFVCSGLAGQTSPFWPERVTPLIRARRGANGLYRAEEEERIVERFKQLPPMERDLAIRTLAAALPGARADAAHDPLDRLMSWEQVRALHEAGVSIGSHTVTHALLTGVGSQDAYRELAESRLKIERVLGAPCLAIAYPNGNVTWDVRTMAERAGYQHAFTTKTGYWGGSTDPLQIPRVNIWENKLAGPGGRFSRVVAEYSIFWHRGT